MLLIRSMAAGIVGGGQSGVNSGLAAGIVGGSQSGVVYSVRAAGLLVVVSLVLIVVGQQE